MVTPPPVPSPRSLGARAWNLITTAHVAAYRASGGRVGHRFPGLSGPMLLLEHVGRKSGQKRTTPLLYLDDGDDLVVVGSRGGSDAPPAWWLNLQETPRTAVQVGTERREVEARTATAEEKRELWPRVVELYEDFETYQQRTDRDIPLVILSPAGAGGAADTARRGAGAAGGR